MNKADFAVKKSRYSRIKRLALVLAVLGCVVVADQITKLIVENSLSLGEVGWDIGIVQIRRIFNPGIAWGLFDNYGAVFNWLIPIVIAFLAAYYLYFLKKSAASTFFTVTFGLILGGAIGNGIDRIRQGGVTDFIDPSFWATFNIADSAISIGFVGLVIYLLFMVRNEETSPGNAAGKSNK